MTKWLSTLIQQQTWTSHSWRIPSYNHNFNFKSNNKQPQTQASSITADTAIRIDLYPAGVYYFTHTTWLARKPPDASENSILPKVCRPGRIKIWSFLARKSHWAKSLNPGLLENIGRDGHYALTAHKKTQDLMVPCPYNFTTVGPNTIRPSPYLTTQRPYTACDSTNVAWTAGTQSSVLNCPDKSITYPNSCTKAL